VAGYQVYVGPAEAECLSDPEPSRSQHHPQGIEAVAAGVVEQPPQLVGRQGRHLPSTWARWQGEGGGVLGDQAPVGGLM
jgi:hypothetical protein